MIPDVQQTCDQVWSATDLSTIESREYKLIKQRFTFVQAIIEKQGSRLDEVRRDNLIRSILSDEDPKAPPEAVQSRSLTSRVFKSMVTAILGVTEEEKVDRDMKELVKAGKSKPDSEFLRYVTELAAKSPMFISASEMLYKLAQEWVLKKMRDTGSSLLEKVESAQLRGCEEQIKAQLAYQAAEQRKGAVQRFRNSFNAIAARDGSM